MGMVLRGVYSEPVEGLRMTMLGIKGVVGQPRIPAFSYFPLPIIAYPNPNAVTIKQDQANQSPYLV